MPKIEIEGKEYQVPVAVAKLVDKLITDLAHFEEANEELRKALHQEGHTIVFSVHGWSIQHPVECRPDMTTCEIHVAAQEQIVDSPKELGAFKIRLEEGVLKYE